MSINHFFLLFQLVIVKNFGSIKVEIRGSGWSGLDAIQIDKIWRSIRPFFFTTGVWDWLRNVLALYSLMLVSREVHISLSFSLLILYNMKKKYETWDGAQRLSVSMIFQSWESLPLTPRIRLYTRLVSLIHYIYM